MAVFSFSSCIINVDNIPDSEVFKSFEPLEWSDDYVFLPTDLPQQIQVWNSKTLLRYLEGTFPLKSLCTCLSLFIRNCHSFATYHVCASFQDDILL